MPYFVAASACVWLAVLSYVVRLNSKQIELRQQHHDQFDTSVVGTMEERPSS